MYRGLTGFRTILVSSLIQPCVYAANQSPKTSPRPTVREVDPATDEEELKTKPKPRRPKIIKPRLEIDDDAAGPDTVKSNSSTDNRRGKIVEADVDIIGFTPSPTFGVGASYFISPTELINVRYSGATGVFSSMDERILYLGAKSFWGNSFYTNAGISKRDYSFKWDLDVVDASEAWTGETIVSEGRQSALGIDISVGNQWQFSALTLGCDWFGYFTPLTHSGDETPEHQNQRIEKTQLTSAQNDLDYSKKGQMAFLRFYLGFAF